MIHWIFAVLTGATIGLVVLHFRRANRYSDRYFVAALFVGAAASIVGMVWGALALGAAECNRFGLQTGLETDYYAIGGCYVEADGHSIPVDEDSIALLVRELTK